MTAARKRSLRITAGDVFAIPAPDGRYGYGQVIVAGTPFYVVIFRDLYRDAPDLDGLLKSDLLLVGWTLDGLIHIGEWNIVGKRTPISKRVPFPSYKVLIEDIPHVRDFAGDHYRLATDEDWALLDNETTVAPIRYQNALLAHHGFGEWRDDYENLTVEHASRRVLDSGERAGGD